MIDISPPVGTGSPVWPGDIPYRLDKTSTFDTGSLDLGAIQTTLHIGAHTDAPLHYHPDGASMEAVPLEAYYGPCQVVEVDIERGLRYGRDHLLQEPTAARLLFKTGSCPDPTEWNNDFAAPEPAFIDQLGQKGVVLVGFDTPSTDLFASKGLPAHQALRRHGMMNLEGLVLDHVAPGNYTLIALPLALVGADASPVRAVLVPPAKPAAAGTKPGVPTGFL